MKEAENKINTMKYIKNMLETTLEKLEVTQDHQTKVKEDKSVKHQMRRM